jgi:RNase P/RNase MRP subunit POP5
MKALKPSARENKRYLLIEGKNLKENIEKAILDFSGILGMSKVGLGWIKTEYPKGHEKGSAIISINREAINFVRASLCISSEKMTVKKVSGTLKGLNK